METATVYKIRTYHWSISEENNMFPKLSYKWNQGLFSKDLPGGYNAYKMLFGDLL